MRVLVNAWQINVMYMIPFRKDYYMELKISSIRIECDKGNVLIPFSDHISFFYGNTSVGKTTLLNLINYALGQNLIRTQIVDSEVRHVCLDTYICGHRITLERNVQSNLITVKSDKGEGSLSAKRIQGGKDSVSEFLYNLAEVPSLEYIIGKSTNSAKVSFANFMWYSYLRQDELDNVFFYLESNSIKRYASNYVLNSLVQNKGQIKSENKKELQYVKVKYEENRERLLLLNRIFSQSNLFTINLEKEITKKRSMIENLNNDLYRLTHVKNVNGEDTLEKLLEVAKRIGKYEAEIQYLFEINKIKKLQKKYEILDQEYSKEIKRLEHVIKSVNGSSCSYISLLEHQFKECLLEVKFPGLTMDNSVRIDKETMIPSIYSCNDEYLFSYISLSSGGVRSIFKICYALAIHILVAKMNIKTLLPSFIMIDTPMKNISERNDRLIYSNLYDYLLRLFSKDGDLYDTQLILVDKEKSSLFEENGIEGKMFTRENPLIPV